MPVLEGESGAPQAPEVGGEEVRLEEVLDPLGSDEPFGQCEQASQVSSVAGVEAEPGGVRYGTVLQNDARLGVGGMFSVERQELLAH